MRYLLPMGLLLTVTGLSACGGGYCGSDCDVYQWENGQVVGVHRQGAPLEASAYEPASTDPGNTPKPVGAEVTPEYLEDFYESENGGGGSTCANPPPDSDYVYPDGVGTPVCRI